MVAIWNMYSDAVFTSGIIGVEIGLNNRIVPGNGEQLHDGVGALGGAAVDELAVLVVAERYVLGFAESLQGAVAILDLAVGDSACDDEDHADHHEHDAQCS